MADPELQQTTPETTPEVSEAKVSEAEVVPGAAPVTPAPTAARPRRVAGLLGLLAGGAIAAGLGFGVARFAVPEGWPLAATGPLEARLAEQAATLTTLRRDLAGLAADLAARPEDPRLAALATAVTGLQEKAAQPAADSGLEPRLAALETRLSDLEKRPTADGGVSASALAAYDRDLATLKSEIAAQKATGAAAANDAAAAARAATAKLAAAEAEAAAAAGRATTAAAVGRLQSAVESGAPYADLTAALDAGGVTLPPVLRDGAETGLPSLAALQDAYPAAARAALAAALRADMGTTFTERMAAFLRSQTGARSLVPHQGSDPDAVLSRAEAALRAGDLGTVMTEIKALPPEALAAMADWPVLAERRLAATDALAALLAAAKP